MKKIVHGKKYGFSAKERDNFLSLIEATIDDTGKFPEAYLRSFFCVKTVEESDDQERLDALLERIGNEIEHFSLRKWIDQFLQQSTKQNLPPFSPTGDFSDAAFQSSTMVPSSITLNRLFGAKFWSFYDVEESDKVENTLSNEQSSIERSTKIKKKKSNDQPKIQSHFDRTLTHFPSEQAHPPVTEAIHRKTHGRQLIKSSSAFRCFDTTARNARCQPMVENLQKGFEQFQRLCAEYRPRAKEPVPQDIKAIFTSPPFSNTNVQYRKALETRPNVDLPLKFLWNGVAHIDERKPKRNDASVLFFFESTSASEK
jgi:rubrerythrin